MYKFKFVIWLSFIYIFSIFFTWYVYGEWCEYKSQIDQCNFANKKWNTKNIEDFVCITWNYEQIAYQVVLDLEFKKIDEQMDKFIEDLEINKNVYFWKDKQKTYIDWIEDIHTQNELFKKEYFNICNNIIKWKVIQCMDDEKISITNSKEYFLEEWTSCRMLLDKKLEIFDDVAFAVLMLNKEQIKADEKKIYDQWQRRNYDRLLDVMMINIWYLERIWQKWPSKLASPY